MKGFTMSEPGKVSFHTLGCKLNFAESSTLARQFSEGGFSRIASAGEADICVVNTCSVTAASDKKCRNLIRHIHRENPSAIIAVTGCYAQLRPAELAAIEGVDIVLGNDLKGELLQSIVALVEERRGAGEAVDGERISLSAGAENRTASACAARREARSPQPMPTNQSISVLMPPSAQLPTAFFTAFSGGDRTRAFLKVQDGCDYHCSYCTIPLARGASRNIPIAQVVEQARLIAAAGQREIVLTGINTGDFGHTTGETFLDLLRALEEVEDVDRYRISSIEPNLLNDSIIAFTARSEKFMPHFHIPLQSGCDRILALMRRRYDTATFAARVEAVRRAIPDVFIGVDVIVAFPGETDEDFEATYAFLERLAPAFLHIFPYSARPGTPAAEFPGQVSPQTSQHRAARLGELNRRLSRAFYERFTGTRAVMLVESTRHDGGGDRMENGTGSRMGGFTPNYLRVEIPYDRALAGRMVEVELARLDENGVFEGKIL